MYRYLSDDAFNELHYLAILTLPRAPLFHKIPLAEADLMFKRYTEYTLEKMRAYSRQIFGSVTDFFLQDLETLDSISRASTSGVFRRTTKSREVISNRITAIYDDGVQYFKISTEVKETVPPDVGVLQPIAHSDIITEVTMATAKTVGKNLEIKVK